MTEKVILTVKNEDGTTEETVLVEPTKCLVGRSQECMWRIASQFVSRRHCLFDVDPPYISVRDLGSLNGTFVNGERIEGE